MGRPPPKRSGANKGDRKEVALRIPTDLFDELERYSSYLNLRPNDAVELAIANMTRRRTMLRIKGEALREPVPSAMGWSLAAPNAVLKRDRC